MDDDDDFGRRKLAAIPKKKQNFLRRALKSRRMLQTDSREEGIAFLDSMLNQYDWSDP